MKHLKIINIFLTICLILGSLAAAPLTAEARKGSKAKTTQTTSKSKSKKSKKGSKSSGTSKKSKKNKSSGKSKKGTKSKKGKKGSKKRSKKNSKRDSTSKRKRRSSSSSSSVSRVAEVAMNDSLTLAVNSSVLATMPKDVANVGLRVNSVRRDDRNHKINVGLNENFTYLPVTKKFIEDIRNGVVTALPDSINSYTINLNVGTHPLSYYINKIDKVDMSKRTEKFVVEADPDVHATRGMEGDIVALWHSHGRYYAGSAWTWQRPFLFETVEDVYTMGYILPYVVPMLENAGAYVMLPRERDTNKNEVIVDNDTNEGGFLGSQPYYKEENAQTLWEEGKLDGFIYDLPDFRDTENPFVGGTYRQTKTVKKGKPSVAGWYPDFPEDGEYAVYISYKSLPNSTKDARYTVNYSGGSKEYIVNQTMGGGTWIYLGTFPFEKGYSDNEAAVTLTNISADGGETVVTADAVKFGGGMGNIARSPSRQDVCTYGKSSDETDSQVTEDEEVNESDEEISEDDEDDEGDDEIDEESDDEEDDEADDESGDEEDDEDEEDVDEEMEDADNEVAEEPQPARQERQANNGYSNRFSTSGMPRFVEGARYWLQWAGIPESVYSPYHGRDDYKDDYTCRGYWVNYLAGGSPVLPGREGLKIPVDVSFALHSDAGKRSDDSTVGTLGIYFTNNGSSYADGTPRMNSRMLTDMVMRQITGDIRQSFEPKWTRRSMWDKSYLEARAAEVPTALIELLSHQNFGDMKYGLDPNFRFTVGRAIYKGIGRFISERKGRQFVVQPLPVNSFYIQRLGKGRYKLHWSTTTDSLEKTAEPDKYIIYERTGDNLGFRKIAEVKYTEFELVIPDNQVHSFKIVAANKGGVSFPSEVLALRESPSNQNPVLVINGFTRVSGPESFNADGRAGFNSQDDFGVPYIKDISFTGYQNEFRRGAGESFGRSDRNYITEVIAGNTFDFTAEHGLSIAEAGFGFVSASAQAVEEGKVDLSKYKTIDLILGKQKATVVGGGYSGVRYRAFPKMLRERLEKYVEKGGDLFVSGSYVASDLYGEYADDDDRDFAAEILGVEPNTSVTTNAGSLMTRSASPEEYRYSNTLNSKAYIVEKPDILLPVKQSSVLLEFADNGLPAAIGGKRGRGKVVVMSVPFESILDEDTRDRLMSDILKWFD